MPDIGAGCHELRIVAGSVHWRIMHYLAADAIVILDVCRKKTVTTPKQVIQGCQKRLAAFQRLTREKGGARRADQ